MYLRKLQNVRVVDGVVHADYKWKFGRTTFGLDELAKVLEKFVLPALRNVVPESQAMGAHLLVTDRVGEIADFSFDPNRVVGHDSLFGKAEYGNGVTVGRVSKP